MEEFLIAAAVIVAGYFLYTRVIAPKLAARNSRRDY